MKTTRGRLARRVALVAAGVVVGGLAQVGCGSSAVTFATGVRVDQLLVRDLSVTVSTTGAVLTWTTRDSAPSQINYGLTTGLGNKVTGDSQPNQHKVELTGLTPDTTYYYQVYGDSTTFRLRTMGGKRQWIAFVSDRDAGQREVYLGYENIENLVRVSSGGGWNPALSVDGKHLAWTGPGAGGHTDIYTAQLDTNGVVHVRSEGRGPRGGTATVELRVEAPTCDAVRVAGWREGA